MFGVISFGTGIYGLCSDYAYFIHEYGDNFGISYTNPQYEVVYEANVGKGGSRSAHRRHANTQFYNNLQQDPIFRERMNDYFGYDVAEYMITGRAGYKKRLHHMFGIIRLIIDRLFN